MLYLDFYGASFVHYKLSSDTKSVIKMKED